MRFLFSIIFLSTFSLTGGFMDPSSTSDHLSVTPSDRALAQLDRDVARSFLNVPISMRVGQGVTGYSPLSTGSETYAALPPNVNLNPAFYCDVIVETVTDYDSKCTPVGTSIFVCVRLV